MGEVFTQIEPQYRGQVLSLEVDVSDQENKDLLKKYKVLTIPTSIFITKAGNVDSEIVGVIKNVELKQHLNLLQHQ